MSIENMMFETNQVFSDNLKMCVEDNKLMYANSYLYIQLLDDIKYIVNDLECSKLLNEVTYDLLTSMYFVSFGLYRNAYVSLRCALELGIGYVYFVDRNHQYLMWKKEMYDIKWCDLINEENGVINSKFLNLFCTCDYSDFTSKVKCAYRECSEYVHGKFNYMQTLEKRNIEYDKSKFDNWNKMFDEVIQSIIILLAIRFNDKLSRVEPDNLITLNEILNRYDLREVKVNNG